MNSYEKLLTIPIHSAQQESGNNEDWATHNTDSNNRGWRWKRINDTSSEVVRKAAVNSCSTN